jgi:hypothetical protein
MKNFIIAVTAMVAIASCSIIAGGGTISASCSEWEALVSPAYWRGMTDQSDDGGVRDLANACWRKGFFERQSDNARQRK